MWEREAKITDAELEVMEVLWQGGDCEQRVRRREPDRRSDPRAAYNDALALCRFSHLHRRPERLC